MISKKIFFILFLSICSFLAFSEEESFTHFFNMGRLAYENKNYNEAIVLFENDLDELSQNYEKNSAYIATTYKFIGNCYFSLNEFEKDIEYQKKSLDIRLHIYGEDCLDVGKNYHNLGNAYYLKNDFYHSAIFYEKAYQLFKKYLDEDNYLRINALSCLAHSFYFLQEYENAVSFYKQLVNYGSKYYGLQNDNTISYYFWLGNCYYNMLNYASAYECYQETLKQNLLLYGEINQYTENSYWWCGQSLFYNKQYESAIENLQKCIDIHESLYNEKDQTLVTYYTLLGQSESQIIEYRDTAVEDFKTARGIILELKNESYLFDLSTVCCYIGVVYFSQYKMKEALDYYLEALESNPIKEDNEWSRQIYEMVGYCYDHLGLYGKELYYFQLYYDLTKLLYEKYSEESYNACYRLQFAYEKVNEYSLQKEILDEAKEIIINLYGSYSDTLAELFLIYSSCMKKTGLIEEAFNYIYKANAIYTERYNSNSLQVASCYNSMAELYNSISDYENSIKYYLLENEILEKHKDTEKLFSNYLSLGMSYNHIGNYELSFEYLDKLENLDIDLLKKGYHKYEVSIQINFFKGIAYKEQGKSDNAIICFTNCLENNDITPYFRFFINDQLGKTYLDKTENDIAKKYFEENLDIAQNIYNSTFLKYLAYGGFSEFYRKTENYELSLECLIMSQNYLKEQSDYFSLFEMGKIFLDRKTDTGYPEEYSLNHEKMRKNIIQGVIDESNNIVSLMNESKYGIIRKTIPFYYLGINLSLEAKEYDKAFEYSENIRSRGFLEEIGNELAIQLPGITEEEKQRFLYLQEELENKYGQLNSENNKSYGSRKEENVVSLENNIKELSNQLTSLEKQISERIPEFSKLRNPTVVKLEEAQKWCEKKRVILEYVMWNEAYSKVLSEKGIIASEDFTNKADSNNNLNYDSYCLIITNDKVKAVKLSNEYDYESAIRKLRDQINKGKSLDSSSLYKYRTELYSELIKPLESFIPSRTKDILIVPDGSLSSLPFEILGDGKGKDFGDKYNISFSPAVSVSMLKSNKTQKKTAFIGIGNPIYNIESEQSTRGANELETEIQDSSEVYTTAGEYYAQRGFKWNNLPGTGVELSEIKSKAFKDDSIKLYTQEKASEKTIKQLSEEGSLKQYSNIHIACHGFFNEDDSSMSTIVLSELSGKIIDSEEDGYLTLPEIALLRLDCDFLNLSACQTGLSKLKVGDGMSGLTRACIVAGTDKVGATLWEVDDRATCEFMIKMYSKVKKGKTYQQAYRETKQEFKKNEEYDRPYFWAAFVIWE